VSVSEPGFTPYIKSEQAPPEGSWRGIILGIVLESSVAVIVCGVIYGVLAWFFARRHRWAWLTLTIASFNPLAWIINLVYLWKRWTEDSVAAPTP